MCNQIEFFSVCVVLRSTVLGAEGEDGRKKAIISVKALPVKIVSDLQLRSSLSSKQQQLL